MSEALIHVPSLFAAPAGAALTLEIGRVHVPEVLGSLGRLILTDCSVYCVDAGNCFSPYAFSIQAKRHGVLPRDVLDRVWVTRTFTIHQLAAVTSTMLAPLAAHTPMPILAVLGLDHLFLEESLRLAERKQVLADVLADLEHAQSLGLRLLITYDPPEGNAWWQPIIRQAGKVRGQGRVGKDGKLNIHMEAE